jgi:hypothetical protein
MEEGVVDLFLYSAKYQCNMLRIAHWFASFILRDPMSHNESDCAVLLLEGIGGSGKTSIAECL